MFLSAKLAAMSSRLLSEEQILSLLAEETVKDVIERLYEHGYGATADGGKTSDVGEEVWGGAEGDAKKNSDREGVEGILAGRLTSVYEELMDICPDEELLSVIRLRYDCHNVKTVIKCRYFGVDPTAILIQCGNIPTEKVAGAIRNGSDEDAVESPGTTTGRKKYRLSPNMKKAAERAEAELDATGSVRTVDELLDAACFADMLDRVQTTGFEPGIKLVRAKIDLTNILSVLRIGNIRNPVTASALLEGSLIDGGTIPADHIRDVKGKDDAARLAESAGLKSMAAAIADMSSDGKGLECVSAAGDGDILKLTRDITSFRLLGAYPLICFVIALEYEVKNLRIILSGKGTGADARSIRERLRLIHV